MQVIISCEFKHFSFSRMRLHTFINLIFTIVSTYIKYLSILRRIQFFFDWPLSVNGRKKISERAINLGIHVLLSKLSFILWLYTFLHSILARVGLMHIGVFILLLLSGERNFGVRLNKPYSVRVPMDIPVFTGTHADFLIIVSHHFTSSKIQYN